MAKFGADATTLSAPDLKAAKHESQGVVDKSSAFAIEALGNIAGEAYKGFTLADLEAKQEQNIIDYMDRRDPETSAIEAAALDTARRTLWENNDQEGFSVVDKIFTDKLSRYKKALDQGVMSPSELSERVLSTTREAVNRNPGLYQELLAHSNKVLEMSGISNIQKVDEQIAKDQKKQMDDWKKNLRELADKLYVTYDHTNINFPDLEIRVKQRQREIAASEAVTRFSNLKGAVTKQQATEFIKSEGTNALLGDVATITNHFSVLFKDASPKDFANLKYQLGVEVNAAKDRLFSATMNAGVSNESITQDLIKRHGESLDSLVKLVEGSQSGEDAVKAMENRNRLIRAEQEGDFALQFNTAAITAIGLLPAPIITKWDLDKGDNLRGMMALTDALVNTIINAPMLGKGMTDRTLHPNKPDAVVILGEWVKGENMEQFVPALNTITKAVLEQPKFKTEAEKVAFMDSFVKDMGRPELKGKFNLPTSAIEDSFRLVDEYTASTSKWLKPKLDEYNEKGLKVRADTLPSGKVTFSGETRAAAELNKNIASRINDGIDALANMMNVSTKEAAAKIFERPAVRELFGVGTGPITQPIKGVEKKTPVVTPQTEFKVPPEQQLARDAWRLRMLLREREEQAAAGRIDPELEKEIARAKEKK